MYITSAAIISLTLYEYTVAVLVTTGSTGLVAENRKREVRNLVLTLPLYRYEYSAFLHATNQVNLF